LGGSQPHQLSPIDFEDKSGPDGPRNGDFLGHILWGTWGPPGFACPAAGVSFVRDKANLGKTVYVCWQSD